MVCSDSPLMMVYEPLKTPRGALVYLCPNCGLLQSRFLTTRGDGKPRISCNAPFGNLRTGKLASAQGAFNALESFKNHPPKTILDIGASRGHFCLEVKNKYPKSQVVAIEPDPTITGWANDDVILNTARLEQYNMPQSYYDWIHLSHTLEHLDNPLLELSRISSALKPETGLLYIEVPSTENILRLPDICEEYFIDKHVTHWTGLTIKRLLQQAGLSIYEMVVGTDHISIVAHRADMHFRFAPEKTETTIQLIQNYHHQLGYNRRAIRQNLKRYQPEEASVIWGAGRLLDVLYQQGLEITNFDAIIDSYCPLKEVFGIPVVSPEVLPVLEAKHVLICSRTSSEEIEEEVKKLDLTYSLWGDLLI